MTIQSVNPRTGESFGPKFASTTAQALDEIVAASERACEVWSMMAADERGRILNAVADALDAHAEKLVEIADLETGLGKVRLTGEVGRTTFQIRSFATALIAGDFISPTVDAAVDGAPPQGHPKFLRTVRAIGPVAVFGASNFPFAFSVLGGDTASALAAGCSVVVKAHPAHPQTSQTTVDIAIKAMSDAGAPAGTLAIGHGFEFGKAIITDPRICAGAFTGSKAGGRALFDLAQSRPNPIPFYGELGSVNPVVVTESGLADPATFAGAYLDSLLMGNGQFCTNPGLLFVPENSEFLQSLQEQLLLRDAGPFLSEATKVLHDKVRTALEEATEAKKVSGKAVDSLGFFSTPEILITSAGQMMKDPSKLSAECFGPTGIVITYSKVAEVISLLAHLEGALVGCLFAAPTDHSAVALVRALAKMSGRVAFNAWPTGVAVAAGQHHGGPYPASTSTLHTSVGIHAIERFLRPVTFQGFPDELYAAISHDSVKGK